MNLIENFKDKEINSVHEFFSYQSESYAVLINCDNDIILRANTFLGQEKSMTLCSHAAVVTDGTALKLNKLKSNYIYLAISPIKIFLCAIKMGQMSSAETCLIANRREKCFVLWKLLESFTGQQNRSFKEYSSIIRLLINSCINNSISNSNSKTFEIVYLLQMYLADKLTNDSIGRVLSISGQQMNKRMKKHTGLTISQFIRNNRFNRAQTLLRNSNFKYYEIAELCGFSSSNYMSNCFQDSLGYSPQTYARSIKENKVEELLVIPERKVLNEVSANQAMGNKYVEEGGAYHRVHILNLTAGPVYVYDIYPEAMFFITKLENNQERSVSLPQGASMMFEYNDKRSFYSIPDYPSQIILK